MALNLFVLFLFLFFAGSQEPRNIREILEKRKLKRNKISKKTISSIKKFSQIENEEFTKLMNRYKENKEPFKIDSIKFVKLSSGKWLVN